MAFVFRQSGGPCEISGRTAWTAGESRSLAWLIALAVLLSFLVSITVLGARNLFDDEVSSLPFIVGSPAEIISIAQAGDVHPPGMYLFANVAFRCIRSYRWMNLVPLTVLSVGMEVFLLNFMPRPLHLRAALAGIVFAALHPEMLMWSNTFRWYCPWTGLAMAALVLFLQPRRSEWRLSWMQALACGLLLALMFYLNYITILFIVSLGLASAFRISNDEAKASLRQLVLAGVLFLVLVSPQAKIMWAVHLPNSGAQRSGFLISIMRLAQALTGSEAYLPWHPISLVAGAASAVAIAYGLRSTFSQSPCPLRQRSGARGLASFGLIFMAAVVVCGLGGKPRSAVLLAPVLAPSLTVGLVNLRTKYQTLILALLVIWSTLGAVHLLGRCRLQKTSMNDRPEQVVMLIEREQQEILQQAGKEQTCGLAVADDNGVVFNLAQEKIPRLMILSSDRGAMFAGTLVDLPKDCLQPKMYIVRSFRSGEPDRDRELTTELNAAERFFRAPPQVNRLSPDPDAGLKRRLSALLGLTAGESLPDYRFVVLSGEINRDQIPAIRRTLHYFVSGDQIVPEETNE